MCELCGVVCLKFELALVFFLWLHVLVVVELLLVFEGELCLVVELLSEGSD